MFVTTDRIVDADVDLLGQLNQGNIILNDLAGVLLVNDDLGKVESLLLKDRLTLYEVVVVSNDNLASYLCISISMLVLSHCCTCNLLTGRDFLVFLS